VVKPEFQMARNPVSAILVSVLVAGLSAGPALALDSLPWRLANYPDGGPDLARNVADPLVRQGELLGPTCNALGPGNDRQIASGVSGIGVAIVDSTPENSALILDRIPQCCQILTARDADARITLGAAIALETRQLAESDMPAAQEIEVVVNICGDEILERSYEIARGQDNLGLLIAQEGTQTGTAVVDPVPVPVTPGGGIPSPN